MSGTADRQTALLKQRLFLIQYFGLRHHEGPENLYFVAVEGRVVVKGSIITATFHQFGRHGDCRLDL